MMIGVFYTSYFLCNLSVGRVGGWLEALGGARFWLLHAGVRRGRGAVAGRQFAWTGRHLLAPVDDGIADEGALGGAAGPGTQVLRPQALTPQLNRAKAPRFARPSPGNLRVTGGPRCPNLCLTRPGAIR
jgi:hypothetical protein